MDTPSRPRSLLAYNMLLFIYSVIDNKFYNEYTVLNAWQEGLTINRTGPHRTAPGHTGPHRSTPDRTGPYPTAPDPVFLVIVCLFGCECTAV